MRPLKLVNPAPWTPVALVAWVLLSGCASVHLRPMDYPAFNAAGTAGEEGSRIRVALLQQVKSVRISAEGPVGIFDLEHGRLLGRLTLSPEQKLVRSGEGLDLGDHHFKVQSLRLVPGPDDHLRVEGTRYRGQVEVAVTAEHTLRVVNYLPMEDYLAGVLPNEVSPRWPEEALKAQAVASRTFAYSRLGNHRSTHDLEDDTRSQVYKGLDSEQPATTQAVEATRDLVAVSRGQFIAAFYHSNCGGHTANVREVWGNQADYLRGVPCGFCQGGPHYTWTLDLPKAQLESALASHGFPVLGLRAMRIVDQDDSGRVRDLELEYANGKRQLKAALFRMFIGPDQIKSTRFAFEDRGQGVRFTGRGWGHGVGFCQEGAAGMARAGMSADQILRTYYPGMELKRLVTRPVPAEP